MEFYILSVPAASPAAAAAASAFGAGSSLLDLFIKGGITMWPLLFMSIASIAVALERSLFWVQFLSTENRVVHDILAAARYSLDEAVDIAEQMRTSPIARFLIAPLRLRNPSPETFRLAQEAAAEKEFIRMRKGDKLLETIVALAPLLGLLGTVTGLIATFSNLNIGGSGGTDTKAASAAAAGIGEALLTTAFGMIVAILALVILRVLLVLQTNQLDYFAEVGSRLELVYRQNWYEPFVGEAGRLTQPTPSQNSHYSGVPTTATFDSSSS